MALAYFLSAWAYIYEHLISQALTSFLLSWFLFSPLPVHTQAANTHAAGFCQHFQPSPVQTVSRATGSRPTQAA